MFPSIVRSQTPEEIVAQSALTQQVEQFERKLVEQQRKDKEQRQSEQIKMQVQLKDFENQLYQQQKRDFEFAQREHQNVQQQIRDYQQKLVQGQTGTTALVAGGIVNGTQQIQQQVRDYERMLVERQEQEINKRQRTHFHLQQKLKEFERLLCEQQQMEFQHLVRAQDNLKSVGINSTVVNQGLQVMGTGLTTGIMGTGVCGTVGQTGMWAEKSQVLEQQTQEEKHLKQKQERLQKFIKEIESELNLRDIEQQKREVTGHLRTQQIHEKVKESQIQQVWEKCAVEGGKYMPVSPIVTPQLTGAKLEQIQILEQQVQEYKRILREKLREQTTFGGIVTPLTTVPFGIEPITGVTGVTGIPCVGGMIKEQIHQVLTIEWIKELVQKLRELEYQGVSGCWAEKKLQQLKNHILFFEQIELPQQQYQCHPQLVKLRDFLDYELPIEIRTVGQQSGISRQLCHELVSLVEEKIKYLTAGVIPTTTGVTGITGEICTPFTGMPIEKLWSKLRSVEYRLRDLRSGEYEPHWSNIFKKIYTLEQVFQQPQFYQTISAMPVVQKMEYIQEHIQQLEWLIQETAFVQRQVPFKYQIVKYQQQKQVVKRLIQLIEEIECQIQEIKIQSPSTVTVGITGVPQTQPIHFETRMVLRQLRGLRSQLKCMLQQQTLVLMHNKMQQVVFDYERQLPREMLESRVHQVQLQQIMTVLKCLEQQLIEQHLQGYQTYVQQPTYLNGQGYFCVEDVYEQVKQQFHCQKQLQQVIREFVTLLVAQKTQLPAHIRIQTQQVLMQQVREFEQLLNLCNEVVVDQEHFFNQQVVVPSYYVERYTTQHQLFQTLFKQLQNVLVQVQQVTVPSVPYYQQHSQLLSALISQIAQIQMQHQQQLMHYQQYPQFVWCIEQQQRPCYRRLQQHLQQLQQLQFLPVDLLQQQQYYVLFKQVQQQLNTLAYIQQQYVRSKLWKNWSSWTQTHVPVLALTLQQLRQQQQQVRLQLQEFVQPRMLTTGTTTTVGTTIVPTTTTPYGTIVPVPGTTMTTRQMIKSISQPTLLETTPVEEIESIYGMDGNNNNYSSWCVVEPESCLLGDDFIVNFFAGKEVEQEKIVADLIQRYIECLNVPTVEINGEFRRKFEQLYFENNKLGQLLRIKVNEIAQLRKPFEELQIARFGKFGKLPMTTTYRPYGGIMGPCTTGITTPFEYESLPITTTGMFGEEPFGIETVTGKPSLRCVEQMVNSLEGKLTQLRLENGVYGGEYPITTPFGGIVEPTTGFYGVKTPYVTPYGITTIEPTTVGQTTVVEVSKKQQYPTGQITQTQIYQECKICPVCGIAVEKELSQPEFELHVNSHFTFTD